MRRIIALAVVAVLIPSGISVHRTRDGLAHVFPTNVPSVMTINDAEAIHDLVKGVPAASIRHAGPDDTNFLCERGYPATCGAAYLFAHDSGHASIDRFVQNVLVPPAARAVRHSVRFEDGSGSGGVASQRRAALFAELGWTTRDLGRVPTVTGPEVIDAERGQGRCSSPVVRGIL